MHFDSPDDSGNGDDAGSNQRIPRIEMIIAQTVYIVNHPKRFFHAAFSAEKIPGEEYRQALPGAFRNSPLHLHQCPVRSSYGPDHPASFQIRRVPRPWPGNRSSFFSFSTCSQRRRFQAPTIRLSAFRESAGQAFRGFLPRSPPAGCDKGMRTPVVSVSSTEQKRKIYPSAFVASTVLTEK